MLLCVDICQIFVIFVRYLHGELSAIMYGEFFSIINQLNNTLLK